MSRRSKKTRSIYLARFATPTRPIIDLLVGEHDCGKDYGDRAPKTGEGLFKLDLLTCRGVIPPNNCKVPAATEGLGGCLKSHMPRVAVSPELPQSRHVSPSARNPLAGAIGPARPKRRSD
ncbi:MAG: hypothetical protein RI963_2679 [Planctomycetota bacterium]|jgi:hypothetical protein